MLRLVLATRSPAAKVEHAATGLSAAWQLTRFAGFRAATFFVPAEPTACLYVATKLGDMMDDLLIIGGLVPSLICSSAAASSFGNAGFGAAGGQHVGGALGTGNSRASAHRRCTI